MSFEMRLVWLHTPTVAGEGWKGSAPVDLPRRPRRDSRVRPRPPKIWIPLVPGPPRGKVTQRGALVSARTLTVAESDGVMPEPPGSATPPSTDAYRPDVQGLRAVAVLLVIAYHLYPDLIPGGYIGVDVFFVISGFLITGNLAREAQRHGRVRLLNFYGRRARRLLPARSWC